MAINVDTKNLSGDILPTVYISEVAIRSAKLSKLPPQGVASGNLKGVPRGLPTTKGTPQISSPAIGALDPGKPAVKKTARTLREKSNTISGLSVTLSLSIKDVVEKDQISTWLFNSEFTRFLNIKIIQSTNPTLTKVLSKGKFKLLKEKRFKKQYKEKILSVQKDNLKKTKNKTADFDLKDFSSVVTETGERIYEIPYETEFTIRTDKPKHVAYFAFVYLDVRQMARFYGMDSVGINSRFIKGITSAEKVINRGDVNTKSFVFYLADTNQIWAGPKHRVKGVWMTGKRGAPLAKILRKEKVANKKINDYREVNDLQKSDLILKAALRQVQKLQKTQLNRDRVSYDASDSYISTGIVSPKPSGEVNLLFHTDVRKLVRTQSAFGNIFDLTSNRRAKEEIYLLSNIKTLKILRRRVKNVSSINRLGTVSYSNIFDASREVEQTIVFSSDEDGALKKRQNDKGGIREIGNVAFSSGVRTFTVTDNSISDITDGTYQYGVYIEVEDGTVKFLNKQLSKLVSAADRLRLYYIDSLNPRYLKKDGRFKDTFYKKYRNLARSSGQIVPWVRAIAAFIDVYSSITKLKQSPKKLAKKLNSMTNAETGNSAGIAALMALIDEVINKLEATLGSKKFPKQSSFLSSRRPGSQQFKVSVMTIDRYFNDLHDSDTVKNIGLDFVGKEGVEDVGVKAILTDDFFNRVREENSIYWKDSDISTVGNKLSLEFGDTPQVPRDKRELFNLAETEMTYLTPSTIRGGNYAVDRLNSGKSVWDAGKYSAMASTLVATKSGNFINKKQRVNPTLKATERGTKDTADNNLRSEVQNDSVASVMAQMGVVIVDQKEIAKPKAPQASVPVSVAPPGGAPPTSLANAFSKGSSLDFTVNTKPIEESSLQGLTDCDGNPIPSNMVFDDNDPAVAVTDEEADSEEERIARRKAIDSRRVQSESMKALGNVFVNRASARGTLNKLRSQGKSSRRRFREKSPNAGNYEIGGINNLVDNIRKSPLKKKDFEKIPNQIRSLMFSDSEQTKNNFLGMEQDPMTSPETSQMMRYNFDTFGKIEAFIGFVKDSEGNNIINKPKFVPLKKKILQRAKSGVVLCRIQNYENKQLKIGQNSSLNMKIYDNCFLMSTKQLSLLLVKKKKIETKMRITRRKEEIEAAKRAKALAAAMHPSNKQEIKNKALIKDDVEIVLVEEIKKGGQTVAEFSIDAATAPGVLKGKEEKKRRVKKITKAGDSVTVEVEADIVEADIENLIDSIADEDLVDTVRGDFSGSDSSKEGGSSETLAGLFSNKKKEEEKEEEQEKDTLSLADIAGQSVEQQILQDLDQAMLIDPVGDYSESVEVEEESSPPFPAGLSIMMGGR
jgi:hypothetical protein